MLDYNIITVTTHTLTHTHLRDDADKTARQGSCDVWLISVRKRNRSLNTNLNAQNKTNYTQIIILIV